MSTQESSEPDANELCFVVSPIGSPGSPTRRRADNVLNHVIQPAAEAIGLTARRADQIDAPGLITSQIIQRLLAAKAVVVDLSDRNPNVYYELAVRDSFKLPVVLIAEDGTELASDIVGQRTIFFESTDLASAIGAIPRITQALNEAIANPAAASPVQAAAQLGELAAGDAEQQVLADLAREVGLLRRDFDASIGASARLTAARAVARRRDQGDRATRIAALLRPHLPDEARIHVVPDPTDSVLIVSDDELPAATRQAVLEISGAQRFPVDFIVGDFP
jgi:hypothetical protein